jgi:TPR repeat protein
MHEPTINDAIEALNAKNYERARSLLEGLTDDDEAQFQLAYLLEQGWGGVRDPNRAREIYQSLADSGDVRAMYYLASLMLSQRRLSEALYYFEESARREHVSAAYWAAELHNGAYGHARDEEKYVCFIERAARLGHIYAKRDDALRQMKQASSVFAWGKSFLRYVRAQLKGAVLAFRDPRDLRLR